MVPLRPNFLKVMISSNQLVIRFEEILASSVLKKDQIKSYLPTENMIISIVDEPPLGDENRECIDVGYALVSIASILQSSCPQDITILSRQSNVEMGHMTVQIIGLGDFADSL
jgi:hypothetical protein